MHEHDAPCAGAGDPRRLDELRARDKVSTWLRMTRAAFGQSSRATASTMCRRLGPRERDEHDDEGQEGQAEHDIGEPHQQPVAPPPR